MDYDPIIGRFCSSEEPVPIDTSGPYARILFHTDETENDHGFLISYTSLQGKI